MLQKYVQAFRSLKRGQTIFGLAPHKPILLLSIIELIDKGMVTNNRVELNTDLFDTFTANWRLLVTTANNEDITLPFYHLQNDKVSGQSFWLLKPLPGKQINAHIASVNTLRKICEYGYFSTDLWHLLSDTVCLNILRHTILETYFPDQVEFLYAAKNVGQDYIIDLTAGIIGEPEVRYGHRGLVTQQEIIVRNGLFQRCITGFYDYRCSFTGMKLSSSFNYNFIDACHIVPFSVSQNDRVDNGIALCPNMHRAFDRGLLGIDENYRVMVSGNLTEDENHPYSLSQLKGRPIILPQRQDCYPAKDALAWHRQEVFKG